MGSLDKDIFWGGANLVPRTFPFFKGKALGTRFGWSKVGVLGLCLPPDEEVLFFFAFFRRTRASARPAWAGVKYQARTTKKGENENACLAHHT